MTKAQVWKLIKKHAAIPAVLAAIVVIVAIAADTYAMKDNGTYVLKDLQGSREAIRDVAIAGELRDGYHRTQFRIEQGEVQTETELLQQRQRARAYAYSPGMPKQMGGTDYEVYGNLAFEIRSRDWVNGIPIPSGTANVTPPVYYHRPGRDSYNELDGDGYGRPDDSSDTSGSSYSYTYTNPLEYGLARIGDRVFFTVPTSVNFKGTNGIYELKFYEWGRGPWPRPEEETKPRTVAEFSLEANQPEQHAGMEILGLEAVGDKLALLIVEHNQLKVRSYDSNSGELLGEAAVPAFRLSGRETTAATAAEGYSERYSAFSDGERQMLSLNFIRSDSEQPRRMMLSFDFSNGVRLAGKVNWTIEDGDEDYFSGVTQMSYRDGKLFVVKTLHEPGTKELVPNDIVRPKRFMIYVFAGAEMIYKGELLTDLNDDNIRAMDRMKWTAGYGYDQEDYRYFDKVRIE